MSNRNPDKKSARPRHLGPLEDEVKSDLTSLNEKHDPMAPEAVTSHRHGALVVRVKELFARLLQPAANIILRRQAAFNVHLVQVMNKTVAHLTRELVAFRQDTEYLYAETARMSEYFQLKVDELRQENILMKQRLERVLSEVREKYDLPEEAAAAIAAERENLSDHDYFLFENRFRGSRESIKKRQEIYLPRFKNAERVLDIGCGRGEFLEILRQEGISAVGIDRNEDMIHICREKGLEVENASAFDYLNGLADASLGGVFASHIIEHLETPALQDFVKLCCRKLKKGAPIAFETPNPLSVTVSSSSFYLDISHVKPIHPEAIKFLLESAGFAETEIEYLAPFSEEVQLQPLPLPEEPGGLDEEAIRRLNRNVEQLNSLLYGFQDYAVMGKKV
ncbi:MAG: class I SAM-dependent methyltransferase [Nitrospinales bacterium]